jgi:hypothetical protein
VRLFTRRVACLLLFVTLINPSGDPVMIDAHSQLGVAELNWDFTATTMVVNRCHTVTSTTGNPFTLEDELLDEFLAKACCAQPPDKSLADLQARNNETWTWYYNLTSRAFVPAAVPDEALGLTLIRAGLL